MEQSKYIGKTVIAMYSYYDENNTFLECKQFNGKIVSESKEEGIKCYNKEENKYYVLPPRLDALFIAPPGEYKDSSGKLIINPDYFTSWSIHKVDKEEDKWSWKPFKLDEQDWIRKYQNK
jgi:hypothetical protein